MIKYVNGFGQHILTAEKGKVLTDGEIYALNYISNDANNESDWVEVDASAVPVEDEEAAAEDYQTALAEMGVEV